MDPAPEELANPVDIARRSTPYRSPRLLAKLATAAFVIYAAGTVASAVLLIDALSTARSMAAGVEVDRAELVALADRGTELQLLGFGLLALTAVGFCLWTHRVARNAIALGARVPISPGMAVGSHFIPIVNLWRPYRILADVWNASNPDLEADPYRDPTPALVLVWWVVWVVSRYAGPALLHGDTAETASQWIHSLQLSLVSLAVDSVALVLVVAVVWALTRRQEARAATLIAPARVA